MTTLMVLILLNWNKTSNYIPKEIDLFGSVAEKNKYYHTNPVKWTNYIFGNYVDSYNERVAYRCVYRMDILTPVKCY
jgi:hypothetical protein